MWGPKARSMYGLCFKEKLHLNSGAVFRAKGCISAGAKGCAPRLVRSSNVSITGV